MSKHTQEFEVHGWNNNQNIHVGAGKTWNINAPDGSSGAIIALHDGHEGEQAEITKKGFMGNDFIDMSNIVGAGGNMIVQQVNKPWTRKGDPLFMQHLNNAWHKASDATKRSLDRCVHRDGHGNVTRIDAIKDYPQLEAFVRTFADGKTYIGVGAWNGSPGNDNDNHQSSAAEGNTDILVTYNDGDATPQSPEVDPVMHNFQAPQIVQRNISSARAQGPGIILRNHTSHKQQFAFYNNYWNGNGTAGANFDHPDPIVTVNANDSHFVSLPESFKGRVQRGTQLPATWAEFQISASNDGAAHGDISLQQGCDGAATISATDGSGQKNGFNWDILKDAPEAAIQKKPDGTRALATTVGNWMSGPNQAAIEWEQKKVGQQRAYIVGGTGVPDVASKNKWFVACAMAGKLEAKMESALHHHEKLGTQPEWNAVEVTEDEVVADKYQGTGADRHDMRMLGRVQVLRGSVVSLSFVAGTIVQGLITLNNPNYEPQQWHGTLLVIAAVAIAVVVNISLSKALPVAEYLILALHILGLFAIVIPLLVMAPKNDARTALLQVTNNGDWATTGTSFMVGLLTALASMMGFDCAVHMSEEVKDASETLPKAILWGAGLNAVLGYLTVFTLCFTVTDIPHLLDSKTGFPFLQLFVDVTKSNGGTAVMAAIVIITLIAAVVSEVATASRQVWAFSRDDGFPCSRFLRRVKPGWNIPLNALWVSLGFGVIIALINLGSSVALNAVVSLTISALLSSYILSIGCLISKRFRGEALPASKFSLGTYGLAINLIAEVFLIPFFIFCFFPITNGVDLETMNWNVVMFGGITIFATVYYWGLGGRRLYRPPVLIQNRSI
ncbi:MAG: hypothetical protein Q9228_005668 [Teloschistes exilis]